MHYTDTLAQRLRALADEIESAERYGLPIPTTISVHSFPNYSPHVSFAANEDEFDVWADYTQATVEDYEHAGRDWQRANADVNGLTVQFAICRPEKQPAGVTA